MPIVIIAIIGGVLWVVTEQVLSFLSKRFSVEMKAKEQELDKRLASIKLSEQEITVLSEKASKHILDLIEDYQKTTSKHMQDFMMHANEQLKRLDQRIG